MLLEMFRPWEIEIVTNDYRTFGFSQRKVMDTEIPTRKSRLFPFERVNVTIYQVGN